MRKFIYAILGLLALSLLVSSLYIGIDKFVIERDKKISKNIAVFIVKKEQGEENISLTYPEYTIIITRDKEGNIYNSMGRANIDFSDLNGSGYVEKGYEANVYIKKMSINNLVKFLMENYVIMGTIISSFLLFIILYYAIIREISEVSPRKKEEGVKVNEEFIKKLKALKLTIATHKIIPEESIEQMKKIVDSLLEEHKYK